MTRKSTVILNLTIALAFPLLATAFSVWWYKNPNRPMFRDPDSRIVEFVRTTNDIEHLRKVTLLQIRGEQTLGRDANKMLDSGVNVLIALSVFTALLALLNLGYMYKEWQKALGSPVKWWQKWL